MRKKIPSITKPDPAYASGLHSAPPVALGDEEVNHGPRSDSRSTPEREDTPRRLPAPDPLRSGLQTAASERSAPAVHVQAPVNTRKVDVRVTALERQASALQECGLNPAHVVRAALRRAAKVWTLRPEFIAPSEERTAKPPAWRMRTTVAVDAQSLATIQSTEDPLGVCSKWSLIRGQLEPLVWAEIDRILEELAEAATGDKESLRPTVDTEADQSS